MADSRNPHRWLLRGDTENGRRVGEVGEVGEVGKVGPTYFSILEVLLN